MGNSQAYDNSGNTLELWSESGRRCFFTLSCWVRPLIRQRLRLFQTKQENLRSLSGAPVNWLNAPRYVYDCRIGSAVTGGRISYTLTEKAEMIRDILFPASYNGALGIKTSLRRAMPLVVRDVAVGDKPTNRPGTVSLYVQTMRGAGTVDGKAGVAKTDRHRYWIAADIARGV